MVGQDHVFEDGFGRVYTVENSKIFENQVDSVLQNMGLRIQKIAAAEKKPQVVKKYQDEMLSDPFVEKVEKFINNPDLQDLHILTVARQARIDPEDMSSAHLLFFIHNFIHK